MSVTIKDIAIASGFSYSTVSKALRNSPLVNDKTMQIIQKKAQEMNYTPNVQARSLVNQTTKTIGLIWPSFVRSAINTLIKEINKQIKKYGYTMLVAVDDIETAAKQFLNFRVDGLLIFDSGDETLIGESIYSHIPTVAYGIMRDLPYSVIDSNHKASVELAISHFAKQHIRNITYVGCMDDRDLRQKLKYQHFINQCKAHQIDYDILDTTSLVEEEAYLTIKDYLNQHTLKEGIFCGSADILKALYKQQHFDPHTHTIVSYDYLETMTSEHLNYSMVGVPLEEIAEAIVETLIKQIESDNKTITQHKLNPILKTPKR